MSKTSAFVSGVGVGAGLMYLMDSVSGRRRRHQLRDQLEHLAHEAGENVAIGLRDASNRAHGLVAESRSVFTQERVDEDVLVARVRSKLGRLCSHPHAVHVECERGHVVLRGPVLADEHGQVVKGVRKVRGVRGVVDDLEIHRRSEGVPSLQGEGAHLRSWRWSPATRLIVAGSGVLLGAYGLLTRGRYTLLGLGLLGRALLEGPRYRPNSAIGAHAIRVNKTIHVAVPVEEAYGFWQAFETFPRFMRHVKDVRQIGEDRYRWRVTGPAGVVFEWDAVVTERVPNQRLAWQSEPGSAVRNGGVVRFVPRGDGTDIHVRLDYEPPAGEIGHTFARLFGADPKRQMDDDLLRFKSLLENGKASALGNTVRREDVEPGYYPS